jgi:uncharacterized membrane-anchored protein
LYIPIFYEVKLLNKELINHPLLLENVNKVAEITIFFWIMKICATVLGETAGDQLSMTMHLGYSTSGIILIGFFLITLAAQLKSAHFHPVLYWLVILATTTVGTEISDFMDRSLGLGYSLGTIILLASLILVLGIWYYREKSLAVDHIYETRIEVFYWIAILCSNTLGTALGDFLSDQLGIGFIGGAMITGGIIALVVVAHYYTKINKVFLFWIAFVLTRPFGATFGDLLTKPFAKGGLNLGTLNSSIIIAVLFAILIAHSSWQRNNELRHQLNEA